MTELWAAIADFPGYEVSSLGRVRRGDRIKTLRINKQGYACAVLWRHSVSHTRLLGPLVASAFLGKRPTGMVVCHNDGNPKNNAVTNLRWDTRSANEGAHSSHQAQPTPDGPPSSPPSPGSPQPSASQPSKMPRLLSKRLNPYFGERLMGWPTGWTSATAPHASSASETALWRSALQQRLSSLFDGAEQ